MCIHRLIGQPERREAARDRDEKEGETEEEEVKEKDGGLARQHREERHERAQLEAKRGGYTDVEEEKEEEWKEGELVCPAGRKGRKRVSELSEQLMGCRH